jgi:TonB family protein
MRVISGLLGVVVAVGATEVGAQTPLGVALEWRNLAMVMSPDSSGVYLWVQRGRNEDGPQHTFTATFRPASVDRWIAQAREFVGQPLTEADTGTTRSSEVLRSITGAGVSIVRRRRDGAWSRERLIVMESQGDRPPMIIAGDASTATEILDSLAKVTPRAPFSEAAVERLLAEDAESKTTKKASSYADNRPPIYPPDARLANREGMVLVSFRIGVDGRADMATVRPLAASHRDFLRAVMVALPALRFHPAERNGEKVAALVVMPFQFSLVR